MFWFLFTTQNDFFQNYPKYSTFPPLIKYKLSGITTFTNQVILQSKILYIIADSDDECFFSLF